MRRVGWLTAAVAVIGVAAVLWCVRPLDGCGWGEHRVWQSSQGVAPRPGDPQPALFSFCHSRFSPPPPPPPAPPPQALPPAPEVPAPRAD